MTARPEYAAARERGNIARVNAQTRLFPEHLPKIQRLRAEGRTLEQIGKRWGVTGQAVYEFLRRQG